MKITEWYISESIRKVSFDPGSIFVLIFLINHGTRQHVS
jgi:hypothetical protein